jgi:hypothetical protein
MGDGLQNTTYDGKPFEAQITGSVSRGPSWWDNGEKAYTNKGTPPAGRLAPPCRNPR